MAISMKDIKEEIKKSARSKGVMFWPQEGEERRIRFLTDFLDGVKVEWHNDFKSGINVPCQEIYDRDCPYCDDEVKCTTHYCWSIFDCESGERMILKFPVTPCTPVSAFAAFFEEYGTLLDRDYKIKQIGKGTNKTFSVIPLEKRKMKKQIKPFSESVMLKYIDKAYPGKNEEFSDNEDEEEVKSRKSRRKGKKADGFMNEPENKKRYVEDDEDEEEWPDDDEDEEEAIDYNEMKPKELFDLCKQRWISCKPKKSQQYYIDLLEQADAEDKELPFS